MSNVIDLSAFLGDVTTYEIEIAGRTVPYQDPTLSEASRLQRQAQNLTMSTLLEMVREGLTRCLKGAFAEEWFNSITQTEAIAFTTFLQNPAVGGKLEAPKPRTVKLRGHTLLLPPVNLGDLARFAEYLEVNRDAFMTEFNEVQLEQLLERTTLEDGSALPEDFTPTTLTAREAQALITIFMNGSLEGEEKKAEPTPRTSRKSRRATGKKS